MIQFCAKLWLRITLSILIALGTSGCVTVTLDLPDTVDVQPVSFEQTPMFTGGVLRVLPAPGGEVLTYRFRAHRRGMDSDEWNPFLVTHLKLELERRGVDTNRGKTVTVRLIDFEAGTMALSAGKRVVLVIEVAGDEFRKRYTGSGSGLWSTLNDAIGKAVTDALAGVLSDQDFQALTK